MATYVLVHGGGHGGWCWKPVVTRLQAAGHAVYAPTLTGLAERSHFVRPGIDLDTHITDVVNLLDKTYFIRDGTGVGVFSPQFGPPRGFFGGLKKLF